MLLLAALYPVGWGEMASLPLNPSTHWAIILFPLSLNVVLEDLIPVLDDGRSVSSVMMVVV